MSFVDEFKSMCECGMQLSRTRREKIVKALADNFTGFIFCYGLNDKFVIKKYL